jgi:hypothetical protein
MPLGTQYHDKIYEIVVFFGFDPDEKNSLADRAEYTDFEKEQGVQTYVFRILGNAIP